MAKQLFLPALLMLSACVVGEKTRVIEGTPGIDGPTGATGAQGAPADESRVAALEQKLAALEESQKTFEFTLQHNVELVVPKPVSYTANKATTVGSLATDTNDPGPEVASVRVREVSATEIGITAKFAPPNGQISLQRSTNQLVQPSTETIVTWPVMLSKQGDQINEASGTITCSSAGIVAITTQAGFPIFTGRKDSKVRHSGTPADLAYTITDGNSYGYLSGAAEIPVLAGATLQLRVYHIDSGAAAQNLSAASMSVRYVAPDPATTARVSLLFPR